MGDELKYSQTVAIVTDDIAYGALLLPALANIADIEVLDWNSVRNASLKKYNVLVIDVDLGEPANVSRLRAFRESDDKRDQIILSAPKNNHKNVAQANALGARYMVNRPLEPLELKNAVITVCDENEKRRKGNRTGTPDKKVATSACLAISDLMDSLSRAVKRNGALPTDEIYAGSSQIIHALEQADMDTWLSVVRSHSSFTYRHVMIVTGFAGAFGNIFKLPFAEKERLTIGALVHDIGKIRIPQAILDKPDRLTDCELKKMRRHPEEGASILKRDGTLGDEVIAIARSHHEFLDGSRYPDGLKGSQIPDIVRVMTVVDIFSALVEARSYKESLPAEQAYKILEDMGPKLDQDIVQAFKPVALSEKASELVKRVFVGAA